MIKMNEIMSVVAIIPARMGSSRFPGKPLKDILGQTMLEHVWRRVCMCKMLDNVYVATCDAEIADEVKRFGGEVILTADTHESCNDRVSEAAKSVEAEIIINVQGDMPFIQPESMEKMVEPILKDKGVHCTDMLGPIVEESEIDDPSVVKVAMDLKGNSLYYTREPIPSSKKAAPGGKIPRNKQIGIHCFRRQLILDFGRWPRTPLEVIEGIDLMRILENGNKIRSVMCSYPVIGVDTPEDLEGARQLMQTDDLFPLYKN